MAKFYAIYTEKLTAQQEATLEKGIEDALAKNPAIEYNGTKFDPSIGIGVCEWDAPAGKDIEDILKAIGAPYNVVAPEKFSLGAIKAIYEYLQYQKTRQELCCTR